MAGLGHRAGSSFHSMWAMCFAAIWITLRTGQNIPHHGIAMYEVDQVQKRRDTMAFVGTTSIVKIAPRSMITTFYPSRPISMTDPARLNSVPKMMLSVYEKIVGLTDEVCDKHLTSEYRDLARAMTRVLCRKRPSPLTSGQPRTWACGIVYVLGRINFFGDKSITPCMT